MQNGVPCRTLIPDLLPLALIDWKEQHIVADLPNKEGVKGRLKSVHVHVSEVCEVSRHLQTQVISVSEVVRQTTVMMETIKERP